MAFAKMSSVFADNPHGLLPSGDATTVEQVYMQYREDYNSILENRYFFLKGGMGYMVYTLL